MFTTRGLHDFQQRCSRFRCSVQMKHARVQTRPAGTSGKGSTEQHYKPPQASEPEPKPQKPLQPAEQLSLARIYQVTLRVQMHRETTASELHKKRIQAPNMLTTSILQEFQQQYPRFRCSVEMKHRRVQTRPAGTSGKSLTERHHKPPHASEPEPKTTKTTTIR